MKVYAQFLQRQGGKLVEALGTDGRFILDGRCTLQTHKVDAMNRMHRLRFVKNYVGFKIMKGDRFDSATEICEWLI